MKPNPQHQNIGTTPRLGQEKRNREGEDTHKVRNGRGRKKKGNEDEKNNTEEQDETLKRSKMEEVKKNGRDIP